MVVSDSARNEIGNRILSIEIKRGGCAGFVYKIQYVDEFPEGYVAICELANIITQEEYVEIFNSAELDFDSTFGGEEFKIRNLKQNTCRCGSSFRAKI